MDIPEQHHVPTDMYVQRVSTIVNREVHELRRCVEVRLGCTCSVCTASLGLTLDVATLTWLSPSASVVLMPCTQPLAPPPTLVALCYNTLTHRRIVEYWNT